MYTKPYNDGMFSGCEHVPADIDEAAEFLAEVPVENLWTLNDVNISQPKRKRVINECYASKEIRIVDVSGMIFVRCF